MPTLEPVTTNIHNLLSPYSEIKIECRNVHADSVQVSAKIFVDGVYYSEVFSDRWIENVGAGIYVWRLDISETVRNAVKRKIIEPTDQGGDIIDQDTQKVLTIEVYEWRLISGVLTLGASVAFMPKLTILNAVRQHDEDIYLDDFESVNTGVPYKFLSNQPLFNGDTLKIARGHNRFLWSYCDSPTLLVVQFLDASGSAIGVGLKALEAFTISGGYRTNALRAIGIGSENINNTPWDSTSGITVVDDSVVVHLGISVPPFGSFLSLQSVTVKYVERCDADQSVWFMNRLGCFDTYSFKEIQEMPVEDLKKEFYETPVLTSQGESQWDIFQRGQTQLSVDGNIGFKLISHPLTQDEVDWLIELAFSPDVFWEKENKRTGDMSLFPLIIEKGKYNLKPDEDTGLSIMEFSGFYANRIKTQLG